MDVPQVVWWCTIAGIVGLLAFDFVVHVRKAHIPTLGEAGLWSAVYVGIAVVFGVGVLVFGGGEVGAEYFAGYVTEKALSVDNLFVFLIIMSSFRVPRADQHLGQSAERHLRGPPARDRVPRHRDRSRPARGGLRHALDRDRDTQGTPGEVPRTHPGRGKTDGTAGPGKRGTSPVPGCRHHPLDVLIPAA
jgi:hypothetical protein